ncbi:hypothetical protein AB833_31590 [Chromatiales bacterium (ex Bugula neritina AB1)]|nr:hypothetical protein AB833_31590 [Chromatiales bacterium (ex Bugula neritina AB1)]
MSWYLKYRDDPWPDKLRKRFDQKYRKRFSDPEDACAEALKNLLFEKLPSTTIRHRDNPDALVHSAFHSCVLDLRRKQYGRAYYPREIEQHGEPVRSIYEAYCFESKQATVIAGELNLQLGFVHECICRINIRDWCRELQTHISLSDELQADMQNDSRLFTKPDQIEQFRLIDEQRISVLFGWWLKDGQGHRSLNATMEASLIKKIRLNPPPPLTDQDRIMIRLLVFEGKSHAETGRIMQLPSSTIGDRKIALFRNFRYYLVELGLIEQ